MTTLRIRASGALAACPEDPRALERYRQAGTAMARANALALVELISENPVASTRSTENRLGVSRPPALRLLRTMDQQGVSSEGEEGARGQRRCVSYEMTDVVAGHARV